MDKKILERFNITSSVRPDKYPRDEEKWIAVTYLRAKGCSYAVIGDQLGITKQRVEQIARSAKRYIQKYDDEFSDKLIDALYSAKNEGV